MEWVHCHVARQPVPPDERVAGIQRPLAAIVMKLLAKTAEERYQTAAGVEANLRRSLAQWESHGRIEPFSLGAYDVSDRLLIPEKLYGREREIDTLLASFDRVVATGFSKIALRDSISAARNPAAGSSSRRSFGRVASARAISSRLCLPNGKAAAATDASSARPTSDSIALGSASQIALFVAPALVLLSYVVGPSPMTLQFWPGAVTMVMIATVTASFITSSGRSAWFVGALLIFIYAVFALTLYVVPPAGQGAG
jgi:Sodium/calcium exchanger protein